MLAVSLVVLATTVNAASHRECQNKAIFSKEIVEAKYAGATWKDVQESIRYVMSRPEYAHLHPNEKAEVEVQAVVSFHSKLSPEDLFDDVMYNCLKGSDGV